MALIPLANGCMSIADIPVFCITGVIDRPIIICFIFIQEESNEITIFHPVLIIAQ